MPLRLPLPRGACAPRTAAPGLALWRAALLLSFAASALACAHGDAAGRPAEGPQSVVAPDPDAEAMREAEGCLPGEASRACPSETLEPLPYVSARALRHLITSQLARQRGDLGAAASELREALLYDPESAQLRTELADVLVRLGRVADAEEELKAALSADPSHPAARVLLGRIAAARGRAAEARSHFNAAREAAPEAPAPLRERIRLELGQGDTASAAALAQELEDLARKQTLAAATADRLASRHDPGDEAGPDAGDAREGSPLGPPDPAGALLVRAARLRDEAAYGWADVGRACAERREDARAAEAFAKAEAGAPGAAELVMARAAFFESRRRFREARDAWLRLYAQRPDAPEVLAALSRVSLEAGEPDAAEAHLRKLIELAGDLEPYPPEPGARKGAPAPESPERVESRREAAGALLRAGLPLLGARRITSALQAFEAGLRLLPEQPELELYKGLSLLQRGRAKEAAALFDQVAAHATALSTAARAGQPAKPDAPRTLLGQDPASLALDAKVQAALARGRAGEVEGSLRRLRALFSDRPAEGEVALGLLEGFDRAGRAAEASALIAVALQKHPDSPQLLFALATALDRSRKLEQALATMRRLLALQPEHAGALNYVGYTLAERGSPQDLAEAEPLLSRAVELRPDDGAVADSFGLLLLKRGRAAEALVELRRADALTPGDPVILSHLGDALLAANLREEAAAVFRRALGRLQPAEARRRGDGARRERTASSRGRADSTREGADEEPEGADRLPEPGDARVRAELEAKLRSCCTSCCASCCTP